MPGEELVSLTDTTKPMTATLPVILTLLLGIVSVAVATTCYLFTASMLFSGLACCIVLVVGGLFFALQSPRSYHQDKKLKKRIPSGLLPVTLRQTSSSAHTAPFSSPHVSLQRQPVSASTFDLSVSPLIDFNLRTTVEETVSRFSAIAQEKGVELSCLFSSDSPTPFRGDPGDLRLILMNLIDSALTTITHGEVVVRGVLQQQTATHATFRFSVSRLGQTPSTSVISPLPNNNAAPLSPSQEEAGIAISKQLVKTWGGQLEIENSPDQSTTIWFTVTLEKQPPKVFSDVPQRTSLAGIRLLLVGNTVSLSDEDAVAWGLTSHCVPRSAFTLSILTTAVRENRPYDVVLFDCQGLEAEVLALASRVRAAETLAAVRLVFMTTSGKKGDAHQVRQAGFDAYLTQPVSSPLLFECLATILGQPPQIHAPHRPLVTRYTLAEARTRGRSRILVVESSLSEQKQAVRIVEELGYRADLATTAREAIEAHSRLPYTAVLLPSQMPGIDGIAVALHIRQYDRQEGTHTLLIGVLQSPHEHESAQCLAVGMDAILVKPLCSANLRATLDQSTTPRSEQRTSLAGLPSKEDEAQEVDLHAALARVDGDKELFDEMTALFIEESPKALSKMHEAITRQDPQALVYSANALKGALGNFAATKAIDTALRLELMGRRGDLSQAYSALNDLEKQLARLQALLADFRLHAAA